MSSFRIGYLPKENYRSDNLILGPGARMKQVYFLKDILPTFFIILVISLFCPSIIEAQSKVIEQEFGGNLQTEFARDFKKESDHEDIFDWRTKFFAHLKVNYSEYLQLYLSAKLDYVVTTNGATEKDWLIERQRFFAQPDPIYELYISIFLGDFDVRVGKQFVTWGVNDFFSPTNNINPLDCRGFIDPESEDLKIPLWLAKIDYHLYDFTIEGIYIPYFEPAKFYLFGSDFAICKSEECYIDEEGKVKISEKYPPEPKLPKDKLENGEIGGRLSGALGDFDLEVSYLYTRDDWPVYYNDQTGAHWFEYRTKVVEPYEEYKLKIYKEMNLRYHIFGAGVATFTLDEDFGFKAELAYSPARLYCRERIGRSLVIRHDKRPFLSYAGEIEYRLKEKYFFSAAFSQQVILYPPGDLILADRRTTIIGGLISAELLNEKLVPELRFAFFMEDRDYFIGPRVDYRFSDAIKLTLGANIFGGRGIYTSILQQITPLAIFSDNDQVFLALRYSF